MRAGVNHGLASIALAAVAAGAAVAAEPELEQGQDRWVPSLAITSGVTFQRQVGSQTSQIFDSGANTTSALRKNLHGDDRAVSPFVGGAFELMTPALPLPGHPRFFASGEVLPTFAPKRQITNEGEPGQLSGPEFNALPFDEETDQYYLFNTNTGQPEVGIGPRPPRREFFADEAKGQGSHLIAHVEDFQYGAKAGVSFAFSFRGHQMRVKPSVGWIQYEVETKGLIVSALCYPRCTPTYDGPGDPTPNPGLLVPIILNTRDRGVFDGVGPGIDLEMDAARFGPIVTSLFVGIHGYYLPGDRDIDLSKRRTQSDDIAQQAPVGPVTESARWHFHVNPWLYRGAVGIRFSWLGSAE